MLEKLLTVKLSRTFKIPVWSVVLATGGLAWIWYSLRKNNAEEKDTDEHKRARIAAVGDKTNHVETATKKKAKTKRKLKIFYGTQTGNSKHFAEVLSEEVESLGFESSCVDLSTYDPEDSLAEEGANNYVCVFIISTYAEGMPPEGAAWFYKWLQETATDFRVQKSLLNGTYFSVFGLGNSLYPDSFNTVAKQVDQWFTELSATRIKEVGCGDENGKNGGLDGDFTLWKKGLMKKLKRVLRGKDIHSCEGGACSGKCGCTKKEGDGPDKHCSSDEDGHSHSHSHSDHCESSDEEMTSKKPSSDVVDLEDLGKIMKLAKMTKETEVEDGEDNSSSEPREMITPLLRQSLEKQGYRLIGSHSGVKLCRWTKSMLRGRGGCYKHSFYGIESHRCMETTPSLACANKCVFCWRHHTNPVGTEWKWKMDDPELIFKGALSSHKNMIKQFRGVPGVVPERFAEGLEPRHCALSLVGEPIMYPKINSFVDMLHGKGISTFLVTNAQFPDAIKTLSPVTQLYVSVDAGTQEHLKKIDRPLFKDFWQRFLDSLTALNDKGQRTVYRLTLVKEWNTNEIESYAKLVSLGNPDFIEVKGVTYCGESKASTLTMNNVPWHEEVVGFVQLLADQLPQYEIASEHEHSNCILLAHTKFKIANEWWTWIDYDRFHELMQDFRGTNKKFTAKDYMAKTPHWAVYGATERGFDPQETRFHRKKKDKTAA
ncbi:S-adenosyl-L-methionine-dependent tRNA 4-demethylwyosine synthase TYW1-like [Gigantopelta aegis]|uniref:S-adenosyl-L-methionine-dependent tRNA 4-demethylwyosine synthase TYW1-like n=1 Tax=Gigantopelta aegis TaxID=1735272 RepID=UPI001B88A861|nr:S-adenosyl-L-methionine-dependent tRNA 4-demethylwyosine synthase TYW1-like [Gigantopelta aegis]